MISINNCMSILNRPGWTNKPLINEGLLHSDGLKQRIANLFRRTSLGNSPTYIVGKIADALRMELGKEFDIDSIADEDIIRIANSESITRGKFKPELKTSIASSRQEDEGNMPDVADSGLPSKSGEDEGIFSHIGSSDEEFEDYHEDDLNFGDEQPDIEIMKIHSEPKINDNDDLEFAFRGNRPEFDEDSEESDESSEDEEDAEEVKTCGCEKHQSPFHKEYAAKNINKIKNPERIDIKKENVKPSAKEVNRILQENYIKSKQHNFRMEERYRNY
jgi:hypothetical protein